MLESQWKIVATMISSLAGDNCILWPYQSKKVLSLCLSARCKAQSAAVIGSALREVHQVTSCVLHADVRVHGASCGGTQ